MANKMIIDASHPEETRVVVLRGNRVEEFDFESSSKRPLRGNIYLAKVTRVEPSLQAAFVDYGGNRHGFLAFSEIHPDYYQIPIADRQALLDEEALSQRDEEDEPNGERRSRRHRRQRQAEIEAHVSDEETELGPAVSEDDRSAEKETGIETSMPEAAATIPRSPENSSGLGFRKSEAPQSGEDVQPVQAADRLSPVAAALEASTMEQSEPATPEAELAIQEHGTSQESNIGAGTGRLQLDPSEPLPDEDDHEVTTLEGGSEEPFTPNQDRSDDDGEAVEQIGGDAMEEVPRRSQRVRRQYKIQEVIKRRQVLLVQVVKEERGNKGAALTTYLSLAGRYCVLMPNTARGGGISRKITNAQDRSRLRSIAEELDVPEGMGVILRTAGATRTKAEVKRDFEYLLRMWETVRETTLASSAATLVYEEGSLIKRAIRDLYNKDVDEIVVAGEAGHREARQFMRLLMPSHVNLVQLYRDTQPVFAKAGVETQLDAMFSNQVTLKSGGYIVINQTEALVSIDVNSGRSTREHNIEDTALRTNIEAADEIARQLRLRDLAGLIVVDFIDMEESRNNRAVERRIKDALKNDRARIQVGRISHFGLLEMSRQRIRTGVLEGSTVVCAHCQGAGVVRSTASIALHVLRALEDALIKSSTHNVVVRTRTAVALYILNQKRANLRDLERRFGVAITIEADETLTGANFHAIEPGEMATGAKGETEPPPLVQDDFATIADEPAPFEQLAEGGDALDESVADMDLHSRERVGSAEDGEVMRRRRRRRRRRGSDRSLNENIAPDAPQPTDDGLAAVAELAGDLEASIEGADSGGKTLRSEGGRAGRSRRSRGLRNRFPPHHDGVGEPTVMGPPEAVEADSELESSWGTDAASTPETLGAPEERPGSQQSQAPEEQVMAQDRPRAALFPAATPTEPYLAASETQVPPAPETAAEPGPKPAAPAQEPARPRRSGWWQRARASIVGD